MEKCKAKALNCLLPKHNNQREETKFCSLPSNCSPKNGPLHCFFDPNSMMGKLL